MPAWHQCVACKGLGVMGEGCSHRQPMVLRGSSPGGTWVVMCGVALPVSCLSLVPLQLNTADALTLAGEMRPGA